jgi:phage FluMu gp28-like protein
MLTRKEQLTEFAKCLVNPIYVIETYFSTFDKTREGIVPFKLFPRQKEIIYAYESHNRNLVTKPRQAGVSTTTAAYLAIKAGFAPKENPEAILIIANKQELAFEFLSKIKAFVSQLPRWLWGPEFYGSEENEKKAIYSTESKKEIMLPNGSRIKAVATSKDALRGFTPTYLVMDEAAFIDNGKEVYGAAMTSLGTGGAVILISTPNGQDPLYYETYKQAKDKKKNGYQHGIEQCVKH